MAQFTVYQNKNSATKKTVPFLLDIQSDLLQDLKTTVVIPLYFFESSQHMLLTKLTPVLTIDNKDYLALTTQLAGISRKELGKTVALLDSYRIAIIDAIDFMLQGV
jgi:toxin CcdB